MANNRSFFIDVSDDLPYADRADLEILGEEVVDHIIERTLRGKDKYNQRFADYSDEYHKTGRPDLHLSGEMLTELRVVNVNAAAKRIEVGYGPDDGKALLDKVEGNVTGSYGQPKPNESKARDFLGITINDLDLLVAKYVTKRPERSKEATTPVADLFKGFAAAALLGKQEEEKTGIFEFDLAEFLSGS